MSVLLILRPKRTLAASHAAPWRVTVSMLTGQTDGWTPTRCITLVTLRFPMNAVSVITVLKESPLPLTDPRDAMTQRMLNIPYRIIW